jgi:hypothetical protein
VQWLLWHETAAFYSGDAGQTWTQIYHPTTGNFKQGNIRQYSIQDIAWTGQGNDWIMSIDYYARSGAISPNENQAYIAFGTGSQNLAQATTGLDIVDPSPPTADPTIYVLPTVLVTGYDGEVVGHAVVAQKAASSSIVWSSAASLAPTVVGASDYVPAHLRDPAAGRDMLSTWGQNVGVSTNYRTTLPSAVIAGGGSVAACQAGIFCGNRTGIAQITNFDTTPQISVVAAASVNVGRIVAGSRQRGVAAQGGNTVYALNGDGQWTAIEVPSGLSVSVIGMVEPI